MRGRAAVSQVTSDDPCDNVVPWQKPYVWLTTQSDANLSQVKFPANSENNREMWGKIPGFAASGRKSTIKSMIGGRNSLRS